ncbi:MAG: hypothetical protein ACO1NO_09270 [Burkholderiaceae bacterium]
MFSNTAYVRVSTNQFRIRHLESGIDTTVIAEAPFTTKRLLIGQFQNAEKTLKAALKQVMKGGFFAVSPKVLIHPTEMTEGGLSEIEERVFLEVAKGSGAMKVVVWTGHDLSDEEVKEKLSVR